MFQGSGLISYLIAFVAFLILTLLLVFSWRGRALGGYLIAASTGTAIWSLVAALAPAPLLPGADAMQGMEFARDLLWCFFLFCVIRQGGDHEQPKKWTINNVALATVLLVAVLIVYLLPIMANFLPLIEQIFADVFYSIWVFISIIGMLLVEQIFRNANPSNRWSIKYICIGIGGIFAYDFFMFSEALLFKQINQNLWDARGIANALAVPLIAISVARNPRYAIDIHVSRDVVFHSVTVIAAGFYLLTMALLGYVLKLYGGTWGGMLQAFFLFGTGLLLLTILFSDRIRAKVRVFLSKHFFSFKYDYREEWLRFTNALVESGEHVPERIIRAICSLMDSHAGMLWEKRGQGFELQERWNWVAPENAEPDSLLSLGTFLKDTHWIIDIQEFKFTPTLYENLELPNWMVRINNAWLIVPLLFKSEVLGFVLVKKSATLQNINWEDRDLLKMAGQQAASHFAQYQADRALVQARQFEAFNRLSAYVVHDLKNILAQQSLIISNAARHKHNPAFIEDVIETVRNSVARMTRLMEQMRSELRGSEPVIIDIKQLLKKVVANRSLNQPVPELISDRGNYFVEADEEQLINVFMHIVQNAQEATDKDGKIQIKLSSVENRVLVSVTDSGCGMSQEFIRDRLFKPFESTKGLTGMGIGVFESREYLRSLDGDIAVTSDIGAGTTFRIQLPMILGQDLEDVTTLSGAF